MAALVSCLVDPDGGAGYDFLSLSAAAAANFGATGADLVSNDEYVECDCVASSGSADTAACDLGGGFTTDATRNIIISGDGWDGDYVHACSSSGGSAIELDCEHFVFQDMRVIPTLTGNNRTIIGLPTGTGMDITVQRCFIKNSMNGTGAYGIGGPGSGSDSYVIANNIIIDCDYYGIFVGTGSWSLVFEIYNNTVYGCGNGITGRHSLQYNNISIGNTTDYGSEDNASSDYNISGDSSAPDNGNSLTSQVATDLMTDPANDDFTLKSGSNAIEAGTDLSAYFTTDITGAARSTPWDIGAFLYSSGGATYNQSTAWAIFNTFQRSSAWAILNSISRDTSWAVFNAHQQDTAWPIKNALNRSSSWKIFNQHDQSTAWPIYNIGNQASAWKIFNSKDQESAWRTYNTAVRDTAWRILNLSSVSVDTAWRILNASSASIETAWVIYNAATRDTAWSIQNQAQADTAWRIINAGSLALSTAWAIYNASDLGSSWRIFNGTSVDSSWKVYNFTSRDSAWNILTVLQQDTSWQVFSSESFATAWSIDSELIPEPVKTFMAASRTVAFHAPSRTLIFFR